MADVLVGPAVDLLLSVVSENINLILGFDDQLGYLKREVEMIQAMLHDTDRRNFEDVAKESVKLRLKWLADFAEEASDELDEFAYHVLRRKVKKVSICMPSSSKPSFLPKFIMVKKMKDLLTSSGSSFLFKRKMGKKIKERLTSLEKINKQASDYGLQHGGGDVPPLHVHEGRETTSHVDVSEKVVGREDDVTKIVQMLTSQSNQKALSVLPIVGMGGQGKTTLAKLIYNNDRVHNHFKKKMWVCVSDEFNGKRLLKCILESLVNKRCELDTKEAILKELQEGLGGQKYLLVLDDVWEENRNKWDEFVSDLRSANRSGGNTILVTTRNTEVVKLVGTFGEPYSLKGLSDDNCWSIFISRAFPNGVSEGFETIGREIVKKCRGLPLVAKVVGSMLHDKKELSEWQSIAKDGVWNSSGVLPILKLSYDNLPSLSLKHCFSYCSIFKKDSFMDKDELIQMWMALGYLQPLEEHKNMEIKDIGNKYFNILVGRSLLQDIITDNYGNAIICKMHDFIHDLAQLVSKRDVLVVEGSIELEREKIPHDIRHLALYFDGVNLDTIGQQGADKLRTLFLGNIENSKGFMDFKRLRVLKLHKSNELPTSISQLIHLRSLYLLKTEINVLSDSITKLYHLQTLCLRNCEMLESLPQDLQCCISLRNLDVSCCRKLKSIPSLKGLDSLTDLNCFDCKMLESLPQTLQSCKSLRSLEVSNCVKLKSIPSLEGLNFLTLLNCSGCKMLESLPQRLQFCTSLLNLDVSNCGKLKSIPSFKGLNSLSNLYCSGCEMLENLPQGLQSLCKLDVTRCKNLNLMASVEDINGSLKVSSLPSYLIHLQTLKIEVTTSFKDIQHHLRQWVSLHTLTLIGQPKCDTLPEQLQYLTALTSIRLCSFGVEALPNWFGKLESLEEIELWSMEKLKFLPSKEVMQRLTKLKRLRIIFCPLLKERFMQGDRPEWSKISAILDVTID